MSLDGDDELSYYERGKGDAVLLLHCWGGDIDVFKDLLLKLSKSFHVICPNLHKRYNYQHGQNSIEYVSSRVEKLLMKKNMKNISVLGWSYGGLVGFQLLKSHFLNVRKFIIYEISPKIINQEEWDCGIKNFNFSENQDFIFMCENYWLKFNKIILNTYFSDSNNKVIELKKKYFNHFKKNNPKELAEVWKSASGKDFRFLCDNLNLNVLLIFGAKSKVYDVKTISWLHANIKNSESLMFNESGHAPHLEQPEEFYHSVTNFLRDDGKKASAVC